MIKIKNKGSYTRQIVKAATVERYNLTEYQAYTLDGVEVDPATITGNIEGDIQQVTKKKMQKVVEYTGEVIREVDAQGNPVMETLPIPSDSVLIEDERNQWLVLKSLGTAEVEMMEDQPTGYLLIKQGGQVLSKYKYDDNEFSIQNSGIADLVERINGIFK